MMKRMLRWKSERGQFLPPCSVRLVVHRPAAFVFHDISLCVEFLLCHRRNQPSHPVGLEPQRQRQKTGWYRLVIIRAIEPGGSIECAAGALNQLEVFIRPDVFGSLKKHVLKQMGESGSSV